MENGLSVVVPVFNERENVLSLHKELLSVLKTLGRPFEIIFIDDGSTDGTDKELEKLKPVKIITFQKNFGQTAAFDAGFKEAKGAVVITLDGDGQNDPNDIPSLLTSLGEGYDVVSTWRHKRKDPFTKKFYSWIARVVRRILLGDNLNDAGSSLIAYKREVLKNFDIYGEIQRFLPSILVLRGYRVKEIKANHRPRKYGKTKYNNLRRGIKSFVDMLNIWFTYKYRARPLHLFGGLGFIFFVIGFLMTAYFVIARLFFGVQLSGRTLPIGSLFLVLFGVQLFVTGLLSDIVIRNYYNTSKERSYIIKKVEDKN